MNITVNGVKQTIDNNENLQDLLNHTFEKDKGIIVELNKKIIHRDRWKEHPLKEGAVIELIQFIGGG